MCESVWDNDKQTVNWVQISDRLYNDPLLLISAANRLNGEVVQSRRRNYHKGRAAIRHYANQTAHPF